MRTSTMVLAVCALALAAVSGGARADPQPGAASQPGSPPKASSLAPHPTRQRTFGAPIQRPILHRRHKRAVKPAPAPVK
jgi:hypothetical protein